MKIIKKSLIIFITTVVSLLVWPSFVQAEVLDKVDINHASVEELDLLYGVGSVIAERIIESRPYESVDDLINVKGIGNVILQKIKNQNVAYAFKDSETRTFREWFENDLLAESIADNLRREVDDEVTHEELRKKHSLELKGKDLQGNTKNFYLLKGVSSIQIDFDGHDIDYSLVKNFRNLSQLYLNYFLDDINHIYGIFKYTKKIEYISIAGGDFSLEGQKKFVEELSKIESLRRYNSFYITYNDFTFMEKLKNVEKASFFCTFLPKRRVTVEDYLEMDKAKNLNTLLINNSFLDINKSDTERIIKESRIPNIVISHSNSPEMDKVKGEKTVGY